MFTDTIHISEDVSEILGELQKHGYEAYVVGGCVRDSLLCKEPHDWDICTNASPEEVHRVFDFGLRICDTGIQHGTVTVMKSGVGYEITTFRAETAYSDHRHPDSVQYAKTLTEDLLRRDFTVNAMAYNPTEGLQDPYHGQENLKFKLIRCVGNPDERFQEDALRILRALRFAAVYGFSIEEKTAAAILTHKKDLQYVSKERIRDELCKMIVGKNIKTILNQYASVFAEIIPELEMTFGFEQNNPYHIYNVWDHTIVAVDAAPMDMKIRLALLFHDIGKPFCYSEDENGRGHFFGHASLSADFAESIMKNLRFDNKTTKDVVELIRYHSQIFEETQPFVRRMLNKIGEQQFSRLTDVRVADVLAQSPTNRSERIAKVSRVRALTAETLSQQQCFSKKDLAINGHDLLRAGYVSGPELGRKLDELFEVVLEHPEMNKREILLKLV